MLPLEVQTASSHEFFIMFLIDLVLHRVHAKATNPTTSVCSESIIYDLQYPHELQEHHGSNYSRMSRTNINQTSPQYVHITCPQKICFEDLQKYPLPISAVIYSISYSHAE